MGRRNHKYIIYVLLVGFGAGLTSLWVSGCSDNPEAKAAKQMRSQTSEAVQLSVVDKDYDAAQRKVMAALQKNRPQGLTKDAALLVSGNLALAKGQNMRAALAPKALQVHASTNKLEENLRSSEKLLLEKERIAMLLAAGEQEIAEIQKLLNGSEQTEGLNKKLDQVDAQMQQLLSEKASIQAERAKIQAVLDEQKGNADALLRQAELLKGDTRFDLEKQAFAILQQRKEQYIEAQSLENESAALDDQIALVQVRLDGLTQNIQEIQQRIGAIDTSPNRTALKQQMREIEEALRENQNRLAAASKEIASAFSEYRKESENIDAVYKEAIDEFEKIGSRDAVFMATARLADSAHYAASSRSKFIISQKDLSERLQGLSDTVDPVLVSAIQYNQSILQDVNADYKKQTFAYFDQSIVAYEDAFSRATQLDADARCSLLKSKLLVLYGKMQLADLMGEFGLANSTETAIQELIQRGNALGVCFTQSETMRLISNEGLDYLPSLPLNMEVFVEGLKQEFSVWKRLPLNEQEAAVDENLQAIDKLVQQYGQDLAQQLEPLKQEMLSAKERGFEEPAPSLESRGYQEPRYGEPNSF